MVPKLEGHGPARDCFQRATKLDWKTTKAFLNHVMMFTSKVVEPPEKIGICGRFGNLLFRPRNSSVLIFWCRSVITLRIG